MTLDSHVSNPSSLDKKRLRFLERKENKFSRGDKIGIFLIIVGCSNLLNLLLWTLTNSALSTLAKKPVPSLVQLDSGDTIAVAPLGSKERDSKVVLKFVSDTLTKMFGWSGMKPALTVEEAVKPEPDSGIDIRTGGFGGRRVTTAAWQASFALSEDFRKEFLEKLAEITPAGVFDAGNRTASTQVALVPVQFSMPQKISEGKWKLNMVANLMVFRSNSIGDVIPFNKEIFIRAVEAPHFPGKDEDAVIRTIYQARSSGLEIYGIRDLNQENL